MIDAVPNMSLEDALEYAAGMNTKSRESDDCRQGIAAFLDKKPLEW